MSENANHVVGNGAKNNKKLFPQKLWDLINDERYNFCLRWSDDGQLVYLNRDEFENSYLKTSENQFHTQKAISFVRQMNMYGFRKVDDCYYENDNFKRGCEHLLKNMIRKHPNKASATGASLAGLGSGDHFSTSPTSVLHHHSNHHHHHLSLPSNNTNYHNHSHHHHHHHHKQQQQHQLNAVQPFRLQPSTILQQQQQQRDHHPHLQQQQQQSNATSSDTSESAAAAAAAAAAVVASALAQQHDATSATRQRLAAAFESQAAKLNGELGGATASITTTTTSSNITTSTNTYATQLQENLLARVRRQHQQQQQQQMMQTSDDERFNALNDDSLSSISDYCCMASGSQGPTVAEQQAAALKSVLSRASRANSCESQQQHCNNSSSQVLDFTGDLKHAQQQAQIQQHQQRQIQEQTQQSQQQQQPQAQLAAQYANLYPNGLDPALLNQFHALQAAGQLANITGGLAPITSANATTVPTNGLDAFDSSALQRALSPTTAATANGSTAAAALAVQQLQQGSLQNNLLLNTLIALGILSITSLTQRG